MKFAFINIIVFLFIAFCDPDSIVAQEWTVPVNISNLEGHDYEPDIVIDSNFILHAVWTHKIENNFFKIYYTRSEDLGVSWINPVDFLENTNLWYGNPHIIAGNENLIYISYEYNLGNPNLTMIYLKIFDGILWSEPVLISENMPGSDHSFLTMGKTGRLYIFWMNSDNKFYYRYYENNTLSDTYCPYVDGNIYFLNKCVCDSNRNLHCVGSTQNVQINAENITYFFQDFITGQWMEPEVLNDHVLYEGKDIALDIFEYPNIVWHERINPAPPYNDGTFYCNFNGLIWTIPELVVEDPWEQRILIDENNRNYIFEREKTPYGSQLVEYLNNGINWEGYLIDTAGYSVGSPQVAYSNDVVNIIYRKQEVSGETGEIWFSKSDVFTGINSEASNKISEFKLYPNPFKYQVTFSFDANSEGYLRLYICDLNGTLVKTVHHSKIYTGKYKYIWDGRNEMGNRVSSGLYLVRLYLDNYVCAKSIELLK